MYLLRVVGRVPKAAGTVAKYPKRVPDTVSGDFYVLAQSIAEVVRHVTDVNIVNLGACGKEFPCLG